jgi:hypothetical protein
MKKDCYTAWQLYKWGGCLERARDFAVSLKYSGALLILDEATKACEYRCKEENPNKKTLAWLKPYEDKALELVCDWYENTENPEYMFAKLRATNNCAFKAGGQWHIRPKSVLLS